MTPLCRILAPPVKNPSYTDNTRSSPVMPDMVAYEARLSQWNAVSDKACRAAETRVHLFAILPLSRKAGSPSSDVGVHIGPSRALSSDRHGSVMKQPYATGQTMGPANSLTRDTAVRCGIRLHGNGSRSSASLRVTFAVAGLAGGAGG